MITARILLRLSAAAHVVARFWLDVEKLFTATAAALCTAEQRRIDALKRTGN